MKTKTILCPTDFSRFSTAALEYASSLAAESDALLYIVYVDDAVPTYVPGYAGYGFTPELVDLERDAERERLNHVLPTVPGVRYEHRYLTGAPEKEILAFAEHEHVDLIVMGSHGRTGVSRVLLGSIAEGVVRHAHCPVLTVKQPTPIPRMTNRNSRAAGRVEKHSVG